MPVTRTHAAAVSAVQTPSISTRTPCVGTAVPRWDHVIWIWMENHSYSQVIGSSSAPYENFLSRACGSATNYHGVTHPSLPNYIAATGGTTAGMTTDCSPSSSCESRRASIFSQVSASRRQWRSYDESMPSNCYLRPYGEYAVKHNPAAYYTTIRTTCRSWDVPFGTTTSGRFVSDLGAARLSAFSFVTPNLCHDTHDCSVATGDAWLKAVVGRIIASATYRAGRTVIVITWDEGFGSTNQVPTIVVAPSTRPGTHSGARFNHYGLLRTTEEIFGLGKLGLASSAASMRFAFHI
jgi:phospholipase C